MKQLKSLETTWKRFKQNTTKGGKFESKPN